jgi:hypothetical protein
MTIQLNFRFGEKTAPDGIRRTSRSLRRRNRPSIPCPPSSQGPASDEETTKAHAAKFEEWPLGNAVFKRVTLDGITTFQLQFTWDPCLEHDGRRVRSSTRAAKSQGTTGNPKPTRRARYTSQDDAKICQLKEQGLPWLAMVKQLPGRSAPAIKARYYAKLKPSPSPILTWKSGMLKKLVTTESRRAEGWNFL